MILEEMPEEQPETIEPWKNVSLWLSTVWSDSWDGHLAVCSMAEDRQLKTDWVADHERAKLSQRMSEQSQGRNLWLSCCSFRDRKRTAAAALQLPGLWVDLDTSERHRTNRGETSTENLPSTAEALEALERLPVPPSCILSTGGGLVVWWLFDSPLELTDANRRETQQLLKHWEQLVRDELSGKHLDSTADLARLLRVPGLQNAKYGVEVDFLRPQLSGSFATRLQQLREGVGRYSLDRFLERLPSLGDSASDSADLEVVEYSPEDRKAAVAALGRLSRRRADDYSGWVKVGLCLAEINGGDEGFDLWLDWSRQSDKFDGNEVDTYREKWSSFRGTFTGFAVANLVSMANEDDPPVEVEVVGIRKQQLKTTNQTHGTEREEVRRFLPFPIHVLPEPFNELVSQSATALQVDPSMVAVPLLSALAGAVGGNSVRLVVKNGWLEPAVLWTVVSAESGTGKTHAFDLALEPVTEIQRRAFRRHDKEMEHFEELMALFQRDLAAWKKNCESDKKKSEAGEQSRPEAPDRPVCWRVKLDDSTVEALVARLSENPRGLLVAVDELSGFFGSFDRYASGSGDESKWLRAYDGKDLTVDRKTGDAPVLHVPRAAVSITGTIQPELLRKHFTPDRMESGLVSRFLLVEPPELQREGWTEAEVDPQLKDRCLEVVEKLCQLEGGLVEGTTDSEAKPVLLSFTSSGKAAFVDWCRFHQLVQDDTFGAIRAAYAKLKSVPARVGLVFHLVRRAAGDPTLEHHDRVDAASIQAGREVAEFFRNEIDRLYSTFGTSGLDANSRKVLQLVEAAGGEITPRKLSQKSRLFRPVETAESILQGLVESGRGEWRTDRPSNGGHASKVFFLR